MKHILSLLILLSLSAQVFAKEKQRVTEQGSSLFYRSWRYPVVTDGKETEVEKDTLPSDTLPTISEKTDTLLVDSLPALPDSLNQQIDTLVRHPQELTEGPDDNTKRDSITVAPPKGGPRVELPDINTCIVYFIFDQDNFITDYSAEFDTIMQFIDYHKGKNFDVIGHTDERGTVAYNQKLSERRSKKVYDVLVRRGVDPRRMKMIGRSELELAIPHAKNEREHLLNRRVEIKVRQE